MPILGLPLTLLPTILPSIMRFNKLSSRRTCPIQFFFRFTTALARHLSSPIEDSISSFVFLSFQLTFSILLHNHISKAFSLSVTSFFIVHVSQPYSATGHTNVLTILFFSSLFRRFVTSSFILPKACFAIPILALTSSIHVPFSVITAPRYLNVATCSTFCPSMTILTALPSSRDTTIALVFLTFIFISYLFAVSFRPSITSWSPFSVLATIPWSSANLTSLTSSPPTLTPSSIPSIASTIIASAYMENNKGDSGHPCRTPLPMTPGSDSPSATLTTACCLIYKFFMSLLSLQSTCSCFNTSIIFIQLTLSKAFSKSTKHM